MERHVFHQYAFAFYKADQLPGTVIFLVPCIADSLAPNVNGEEFKLAHKMIGASVNRAATGERYVFAFDSKDQMLPNPLLGRIREILIVSVELVIVVHACACFQYGAVLQMELYVVPKPNRTG